MPDPPQDFTLPPPWISSSGAASHDAGAAGVEEIDSAGAAARRALLARVTARLPAPPATVAVAGDPGGAATARALAAGGWQALGGDEEAGVAAPAGRAGERCDAVLLLLPAAEPRRPALEERIARARRRLADGGRLLVAGALARTPGGGADGAPSADEVTATLAEAGFVIRRREDLTAFVRPLAEEEATRARRGDAAAGAHDRARTAAWQRLAAGLAGGERGWELFTAVADPLVIRPGRPEDEVAIGALFSECFHADRDLAHWRWEYRQGPYGPAPVSVGVAADGRLVSHYAGYPVRLIRDLGVEPRVLTAFQIGDTMTAPDVRKVGRGPTSILARTVAHFYARNCAGRVAFNYGFNRGNIQRFSVLFVGAHVDEAVPFRVLTTERRAARPPGPRGLPPDRLPGGADHRLRPPLGRALRPGAGSVPVPRRAGRPLLAVAVRRSTRRRLLHLRRLPAAPVARLERVPASKASGWSGATACSIPAARRRSGCCWRASRPTPSTAGRRPSRAGSPSRPAWWDEIVAGLGFERRPEPEQLALVYVPWQVDPAADFASHFYYTKGDSDLF